MKKVLSLVLVIAMVLSCVPFAFAEEEAASASAIPAVWASYDAGEAFAVDTTKHTFTTDAAASYPNGTLPAKASSIWSVGRYEHGTGYDRFSKYGYLLRAGFGFRANEDTVNTTLNLTETATIEPVRLANMVWTQNATVKLEKTTEIYHPHTNGSAAVYGDGGYSIPDPNSYSATLGYSFGNTIVRENSSLGYQNAGSVHPAIRFVAPATGLIRPTLLMKGSVNVAWQIFKLDAAGNKTPVYPAKGAESLSIVTPDASVVVPEKWATGWASMPASYTTFDSETIWVEAGDTLELRFAAKGPKGKAGAFTLATYVLDYINPITEWAVEYDASQTLIDFRAQRMFGMDTDLASTDLVETDVDGVFEIPADFVSGTTVTVTEAYLGTNHVIKATLTKSVNHYDAGDGFAVDTEKHPFTGEAATDYPNASLPAKKSPVWLVGRYGYSSGNYDYFAQYGNLHRLYVYNKAYEDDKSGALQLDPNNAESVGKDTTRYPVMAWSSNGLATLPATELTWHWMGGGKTTYGDGGYAFNGVGGYNGILGYGFNTAFAKENSSLGYQNSGSVHPAIIFTAPKTGLVRPTLKLSGPLGVVYKLYKIDSTGATTDIYPASAEESVSIVSPHEDVPNLAEKWKNGWTHIPSVRTTRDSEVIWVEAGDKIELRFAASGPEGKNQPFDLNYFAIDYANPMVSEVVARYHGDERVVDLREFKKLPGNHDMVAPEGLTETETDGVFMVNEDFVSGTVVSFVEKQGDITHLIRVTLEEWATSFDIAELFETTQTFVGAESDYPHATLPVAMVNDGSQVWSLGHYTYSSSFKIFSYYNRLFRSGTNSRSPQDTTNTRPTRMTYTIYGNNDGAIKLQEGIGYYTNDPNGNFGAFGYSFGTADTAGYATTGSVGNVGLASNYNIKSAIFKAPYDGVINPVFRGSAWGKTTDGERVLYRMDKVAADGTRTRVYPLPNNTDTRTVSHWSSDAVTDAIPEEWKTGWGVLTPNNNQKAYTTEDQAYVRVNKGDRIELMIAPINYASTGFDVDILKMNYDRTFGSTDELFAESPLTDYDEEIVVTYPTDSYVELIQTLPSIMASGIAPRGTIEYKISGTEDVLGEIAGVDGVFALVGALTYGEPTIVTAEYYNPGESSANGNEPRFTTSINVFVQALSETKDTFNNYHIWDLSEMTYDFDHGMALPYYANETERSMYGVVDLGLTEDWKGATVAFSDPTKFEYLGNGRIRALKLHDYTTAGGVSGKKDNTVTTLSNGGSTTLVSQRDKHSMGNPIVMTVTAPDGGIRQFGLWAFNAKVQDRATEDANTYKLYVNNNPMANAVVSVDFPTTDGKFLPGYRDATNSYIFNPIVDHRFSQTDNIVWQMKNNGGVYVPLSNGRYWDLYRSNQPYHKVNGISQTFTAPKDGTINLTKYFPTGYMVLGADSNGYIYLADQQSKGKNVKYSVELYDAKDNLISTLWYQELGALTATDTKAYLKADTLKIDETRVTMAEDEAKTLTFDVKKGEKVRVAIRADYDRNYGSGGHLEVSNGAAPLPVWSYVQTTADSMGDTIVATPVAEGITADNVLVMVYDQAGNLVQSAKGEDVTVTDGQVSVAVTDATAAYAKLFFFDSLNNIKPLSGDIAVRK